MNVEATESRGEQRVALVVSSGAGHGKSGGEGPGAVVEAAGLRVLERVDGGQAAPAVSEPGALAGGRFSRLARSLFRGRAEAEREALQRAGAAFLHAATLGMNVEFARLATDVARRERWGALNYPT